MKRFMTILLIGATLPNLAHAATTSINGSNTTTTQSQMGMGVYNGAPLTTDQVTSLQNKLRADGLYRSNVNGRFDTTTFNAVREYQRRHSLPTTGVLDTNTVNDLGLDFSNRTTGNANLKTNGAANTSSTNSGDNANASTGLRVNSGLGLGINNRGVNAKTGINTGVNASGTTSTSGARSAGGTSIGGSASGSSSGSTSAGGSGH